MAPTRAIPRIKQVRAFSTHASKDHDQGADCHDVQLEHWINGVSPEPIANPMSVHPKYAGARTSWGINALGTCVVEVEADDGTTGVGVTTAGEPGCYLVEKHLSRFVEGADPRDVERIWDQMWRATTNYGRKGLPLQAISAVDLAIWDLLGKLRNELVYALLGGKTKDRLPVYCTTAKADVAKRHGFAGAKVPCPHGPAAGDEGFRANVAYFKAQREKVGPDFPLMLDCYMALTLPYTVRLAKALEPHGLKWIEECLPPDDYDGYKELRQALLGSSVLVTTGEHEYSRYGFRRLIADRAADVLQPDITWMGGLTEARRVVAMATAYDIPVIPHGSSVLLAPAAAHSLSAAAARAAASRSTRTTCSTPSTTAPSRNLSTYTRRATRCHSRERCVAIPNNSNTHTSFGAWSPVHARARRADRVARCVSHSSHTEEEESTVTLVRRVPLLHTARRRGGEGSAQVVPYFGSLFSDEPLPKDGFIDLPDRPGFGVTLVRDGLHRPWARTAEESAAQYAVTSQADSGLVGDETRPRMGI